MLTSPASGPLHVAWLTRLRQLMTAAPVSPRALHTREQLDQAIRFDARWNLLHVPERALNPRFAVAEWLWISFGLQTLEPVAQYNAGLRRFSDNGVTLTGAYGPHVAWQRHFVMRKLRQDSETRQAVIEVRRPRHRLSPSLNFHTKDEPCTLSLQFLLRERRLNCIATMRSSDVWLGLPYDAFTFSMIQNALAGELGCDLGWTSLRLGSSHLYEVNAAPADRVLNACADRIGGLTLPSPRLPGWPPTWLEHVLVTRTWPPNLAQPEQYQPWASYARVLMAETNAEAYDVLEELV